MAQSCPCSPPPRLCPAASRALVRLRHDRNAGEDAGGDSGHRGDTGLARPGSGPGWGWGWGWGGRRAALRRGAGPPLRTPGATPSPASGRRSFPFPSGPGGARAPSPRSPEAEKTEREKSLLERGAAPLSTPLLLQSPARAEGPRREAQPRGRITGSGRARPGHPLRGGRAAGGGREAAAQPRRRRPRRPRWEGPYKVAARPGPAN